MCWPHMPGLKTCALGDSVGKLARLINQQLPHKTTRLAIELCDAQVQTKEFMETADAETQTNQTSFTTAGVQTDKNQLKIAESQTDATEIYHVKYKLTMMNH